jgi:hypothetical protein
MDVLVVIRFVVHYLYRTVRDMLLVSGKLREPEKVEDHCVRWQSAICVAHHTFIWHEVTRVPVADEPIYILRRTRAAVLKVKMQEPVIWAPRSLGTSGIA